MQTIQSAFSFEAAHRLFGVDTYSKECRDNIHGHSYKVFVRAARKELDNAGMVMDFKLFKNVINRVIVEKYDHTTILRDIDTLLPAFVADGSRVNIAYESPTAEWMAKEFFNEIQKALDEITNKQVVVVEVSVQETENNIATYSKED